MIKKLFSMSGGLAVSLLALGLVLAGCPTPTGGGGSGDDSGDTGGGGTSGETFPAAKGKLTITDIPSDKNGKYVYGSGVAGSTALIMMTDITGYGTAEFAYKLVKIVDGQAVIPLYTANASATSYANAYIPYEGNDTITSMVIYVLDSTDGTLTQAQVPSGSSGLDFKQISGTFSGGSLTIPW